MMDLRGNSAFCILGSPYIAMWLQFFSDFLMRSTTLHSTDCVMSLANFSHAGFASRTTTFPTVVSSIQITVALLSSTGKAVRQTLPLQCVWRACFSFLLRLSLSFLDNLRILSFLLNPSSAASSHNKQRPS